MRRVLLAVGVVAVGLSSVGTASAAGVGANALTYECAYAFQALPSGFASVNACVESGASVSSAIPGTPTTGTGSAQGCIYVVTGAGFDSGCGSIPSTGITVDPTLSASTMSFSLPSDLAGVVSATITITGTGVPFWQLGGGPYITGTLAPTATATVGGGLFLDRTGSVNPGAVASSTVVGGGSLAGGFAQFGRGVYAAAGATAP